jgi:hypothetical protein
VLQRRFRRLPPPKHQPGALLNLTTAKFLLELEILLRFDPITPVIRLRVCSV